MAYPVGFLHVNLTLEKGSISKDLSVKVPTTTWPAPSLMWVITLLGDSACNHEGGNIGDIKEITLDMRNGKVRYKDLSFNVFFGIEEKLFEVPWAALTFDRESKRFLLGIEKAILENAPTIDKDRWPNMANQVWTKQIHPYYVIEITPVPTSVFPV